MKMNKLTFATGVALTSLTILAKTQITPPTLASKEYTGQKQTADVPSSADWTVAPGGNAGGTDAGGYSVMLILTDEDSCEWKPTTGVEIEDAVAIVPFAIAKANNSWTTEPSINGWKWGETKSTPVAAAKFAGFGEPSVTYSGTAVDGTAVSGATSILAAGTYTATFKVADTPNYAGLSQDVDFEVTKGDISGGGGGGGGSGVTLIAEGFEGPYDGNKHTVTVSVTGAEGETFDITYSNEENGTYSPTKPSYKNVGSYTVWYKINSKSYAEYRSSLVVKINAAVVTPPAIAPKVYTGEKQVADVAESALYETVVNLGGKDVNNYDVILQLNDPGNYVWKPTQGVEIDGELAMLAFAITKAENSWLVQPSMEGWEWGKTASTPVGQSKFGNPPTLTYNGTKADGTPVSGATSVTAPGQYTAVFTVADTVNYAGLTESVPFVVTLGKINVDPFDPTEPKLVVEGFEGPYDGENHTITVRIEGAGSEQFNITYSKTGVGEYVAENPQFKNACDTKVWYAINSPNFTALTNSAPMKITKAEFPGDGEEPGGGTVPEGGASKFDTVAMYDGEGHSIKANDLVTAFKSVIGNDFVVSFALGESGGLGQPDLPPTDAGAWMAVAPAFTNVCATSVWYKVTSANYEDFTHEARVTVTNRPVTLTSGTKLDFVYDGKPHAYTNLTVTAGSFVAGEGIATSNWATVTTVAEGEVGNAFDYEALDGTKLSNYDFTVVTGKIAVVSPEAVVVTVTGHVASVTYDGLKKSVSGYDVVSISDPLYTAADFKFTGQSATNGTNAGTYPMGLKSEGFVNTNPNFATVVFNVTDGKLVISQAANVWTVEPAIDGWTYGETAKTPVGAAKFGEVTFTYNPTTVGAAGDYTMTATVVGTANYTGLSKTVAFKIAKAALPGGGEEPGGGTVPEGGLSKFDTVAMYDGEGHAVKTNEIVAAFKSVIGNDFVVSYALGESGGQGQSATPWSAVAPDFTNVCVTSVWYKVTSENYEDFTHEARVTVTNRPVTLTSGTKIDFTYDGKPHAFTNLTVTAGSFVAGEGVATSNWATVTTVAEGEVGNAFDYEALDGTKLSNYDLTVVTGKIAVVGRPSPQKAVLTAGIDWKLLAASGTFMAQLKVTCTSGLATGISDLRFMFADRVSGDVTTAALWDTPNRSAKSTTMTVDGDTYRYVALDAARITSENVPATYGVSDLSASAIPISERTIELYVRARVSPTSGDAGIAGVDDFVGYVCWTSGDEVFRIPVSAGSISAFRVMLSSADDNDSSGSGTVKRPAVSKATGFLSEKSNASWSATAAPGCVFAGWSAAPDAPECVAGHLAAFSANELKNKKLTFKVGAGERISPTHVAAAWARIDEDKIRRVALTAVGLEVDCKSYVTATVSGLPKGLKFNAKALALEGVLNAKDAVYTVKVAVKNASGYTWKGSFRMAVAVGVVTDIAPAVGVVETGAPVIVGCDDALGKTTGTKVYAAGRKASIRAVPTKGVIFLGWYEDAAFVTPATGLPKGYLAAAQSVVVPAEGLNLYARFVKLDDWAVGTFDGIFYDAKSGACGTVTLTISSKGKVSGKIQSGGKACAFNAATLDDARMIDGELAFVAHPTVKVDGEVRTLELLVGEGEIEGLGCAVIFCDGEDRTPIAKAVQNGWKSPSIAFPTFPTGMKTLVFSASDGLALTFAAKGVVRVAGKVDGKKISCTTQILPIVWRDDGIHEMVAQICVYVPSKSGYPGSCKVYDVLLTVGADGKFESVR